MSEKSIGVEIDGKETLIPTIVPTLTDNEIRFLKSGGDVLKNDAIIRKAVDHAVGRIEQGLSPFKD